MDRLALFSCLYVPDRQLVVTGRKFFLRFLNMWQTFKSNARHQNSLLSESELARTKRQNNFSYVALYMVPMTDARVIS